MARHIDPSAELALSEMESDKLYGEVVVKFEGGKVVLIKRTETIKPANLTAVRNNREDGEDRDG